MDLTVDVGDYKLNVRAAVIIIHRNKILVHKNVNSDHYALIGGRVKVGEDSANTVKREIREELGKEIKLIGYVSTVENFFEWIRRFKVSWTIIHTSRQISKWKGQKNRIYFTKC